MGEVERVKRAVRLDTIVREDLGRADRSQRKDDLWWKCPFHDENDPSFHVTKKDGEWFFRCFGCDASGDVLDWMQDYRGMEFREALEALAERGDVELSGGKGESTKREAGPAPPPPQDPQVRRYEADGCVWAAEVHYPDGDPHSVRMLESGTVTCDCKGYQYRGQCRHRELAIDRFGEPRTPSEPPADDTKDEPDPPKDDSSLTVKRLAADKELPVEFLRELGISDMDRGVEIPYLLPDGSPAPRPRYRYARSAKEGSRWGGDTDDDIIPYGLDKLEMARDAGYLTLVEGESDCWTLWNAGEPALGIPGASQAATIRAEDLSGIGRIYVMDERDGGAKSFIRGVAKRLAEIEYGGEGWIINCGKAKDPNEAWQMCDGDAETFRKAWDRRLGDTRPLPWPEPEPIRYEVRNISRAFLNYGDCGRSTEGYRGVDMAWWRDGWYVWNGRYYREMPEGELRGHMAQFIESRKWEETKKSGDTYETYTEWKSGTKATITNVLQSLSGQVVEPGHAEPPIRSGRELDDDLLVLQNGILKLERLWESLEAADPNDEDARDIRLQPHTPEIFTLNGLPYEYDPYATCPRWLRFLQRVLPDEDKRWVLCQWAGYCLIPTNRFQKLLVMVGEGANGKSVIQDVIKHLVGPHNCSAAPLEQLHKNHALQPLVGKLLNLANEWGYLHQTGLSTLKQVSGGDAVTVNPKHKPPFETVLPVRWMVSTNQVPSVQDRSDAFWRRLMLMKFHVQIPPEEQIEKEDLVGRLTDELPGILNWALTGLYGLIENEGFQVPETMELSAKEMREDSNPTGVWCDATLKITPGGRVDLDRAYSAYSSWCRQSGYKPLNKANFGKEIRRWYKHEEGRRPESFRRRVDGQRHRFYRGISIHHGEDYE